MVSVACRTDQQRPPSYSGEHFKPRGKKKNCKLKARIPTWDRYYAEVVLQLCTTSFFSFFFLTGYKHFLMLVRKWMVLCAFSKSIVFLHSSLAVLKSQS